MNTQFEKIMAPIQKLNALSIKSLEDITALQLSYAEKSIGAGIESLKGAVSVKDIESLKAYFAAQTAAAKGVVENTVSATDSFSKIGKAYAADAKRILDTALS